MTSPTQPREPDSELTSQPQRALSLFDTTSIIVGIIIGSAIYRISPLVTSGAAASSNHLALTIASYFGVATPSAATLNQIAITAVIGVWLVGGIVAFIGAMCYAELATAFPQAGGTYVYLSEALGRTVGFAFAWCEFWIVRPGNIGAVAFVMAAYAERLLPVRLAGSGQVGVGLAAGAIALLACLNALGIRSGKRTQNVLTAAKLIGLMAIVFAAMFSARVDHQPHQAISGQMGLSLVMIMFAYGGWADMSFVAAEVRQPQRNIFRALALGTATVAAIYVAVNVAFLHVLGLAGVVHSETVAADALALSLGRFGGYASQAISALVVVSCLGAINGMLFTGARVFYALGTHHDSFRWLGAWNERTGVPLRSLVLQAAITLGLVVGFGRDPAGFERLVVFTAPFYWGFIALVGLALIVLRQRGATSHSTFRVPLYPLTPLVFAATSGAMVYATVDYALSKRAAEGWWATAVVIAGVAVGFIDWQARHRQQVAAS